MGDQEQNFFFEGEEGKGAEKEGGKKTAVAIHSIEPNRKLFKISHQTPEILFILLMKR
jgi:hypothetical protein